MCKEVEYVNTCVELYVLRLNKLNVCTRVLHLYSTCKQFGIYVHVHKVNVYNCYMFFGLIQIECKNAKQNYMCVD